MTLAGTVSPVPNEFLGFKKAKRIVFTPSANGTLRLLLKNSTGTDSGNTVYAPRTDNEQFHFTLSRDDDTPFASIPFYVQYYGSDTLVDIFDTSGDITLFYAHDSWTNQTVVVPTIEIDEDDLVASYDMVHYTDSTLTSRYGDGATIEPQSSEFPDVSAYESSGTIGYDESLIRDTPVGAVAITNVTELQAIKDDLSATYYLANDIDASATATWNPDGSGGYLGFEPIGDETSPFTGKLYGNGHTITGLYSSGGNADGCGGLFGWTYGSEIYDVGVVDYEITGTSSTGGLVGLNYNSSTITNCYATGDASGTYTGGLVGYNRDSSISN